MRKNSKERKLPEINTSALPDIIFMLLFFFMVVTVLRKRDVKVKVDLPEARQLVKLKHPSIHHHIFVGVLDKGKETERQVIQLNDKFIAIDEIEKAVVLLVRKQPEVYQSLVTTYLYADAEQDMAILSELKLALRKAEQLNLGYVAVGGMQ